MMKRWQSVLANGTVVFAVALGGCIGVNRDGGSRVEFPVSDDGVVIVDLREPTPIAVFSDDGVPFYAFDPRGPVRVLLPMMDVQLEADSMALNAPLDVRDPRNPGDHPNTNPIGSLEFSTSEPADAAVMWERIDAAIDLFGVDPDAEVSLAEIRHTLETTKYGDTVSTEIYNSPIKETDEYQVYVRITRSPGDTFRTVILVSFFNGVYGPGVAFWPPDPSMAKTTTIG